MYKNNKNNADEKNEIKQHLLNQFILFTSINTLSTKGHITFCCSVFLSLSFV